MSFTTDIQAATRENEDFRRVLFTTERTQLVVMSVLPGDDVGLETHDLDQVLVFVTGRGYSLLGGKRGEIGPGTVVVVPAGTEHNFVNTGNEPLKLYTVYAPPEHADGTVHRTKAEAEEAEAREHGHGAGAGEQAGHAFTVGSLRRR
ncbi:cupin domain-containing protein [Vulgatibacter sp.]|uniref:cupin domain-containing protein n=1 Tax=Vulgatibacter sp. TaxID=1971226 RepID=UPI00356B280D